MLSNGSGARIQQPQLQAPATLAQAAAVSTTWYDVLETTTNTEALMICFRMDTANEDLECRVTVDGETVTGTQTAVADTYYYMYLRSNTGNLFAVVTTTPSLVLNAQTFLKSRSIQVELRKTSANGANTLRGSVLYNRII